MNNSTASSFRTRTEALLGVEPIKRLSNSCVAIAGLGGVGGAILSTMVRMGVGRFHIADPCLFDMPDLNRQWTASHSTLNRNKAEVYAEFIRSVNPKAEVEVFTEGIREDNIQQFLEGADLLVEALDVGVPPSLRLRLADQARQQGIYNILPPIIGFGTMVAIASPDGMPMNRFLAFIEKARQSGHLPPGLFKYFNPALMGMMERSMTKGVIPSISAATALVASVVATESVMILGGQQMPGRRDPVCLPDLILLDLSQLCLHIKHIKEIEEG